MTDKQKRETMELAVRFCRGEVTPVQLNFLMATKGINETELIAAVRAVEWHKTKQLIKFCCFVTAFFYIQTRLILWLFGG